MGPKGNTKGKGKDSSSADTIFDFPPAPKKSSKQPSKDHGDNTGSASKYTTDKLGNTVLKSKLAEDAALEAARAAAKARRAEKEAAAAAAMTQQQETNSAKHQRTCVDQSAIDIILKKSAAGQKITHKEKRLLSEHEKSAAEDAARASEVSSGLQSFSISLQTESSSVNASASVDVIAENISISAPSRQLLVDATVRLVGGRKYGLLGPNGRGKTTLLKYLAARKIPLPVGMEVLLVEQEVPGLDTPVIEQVLAADARRARLLAEESELNREFELQERISNGELDNNNVAATAWAEETWVSKLARFVAVGAELEATGADTCESKVRKILTGLGFTAAMQDGPSITLSGGWRMRVSLACALFMEPHLLLLDEPTNHLDLNAVLWLDDYLENHWKNTLLVVSHDADFLDSVCTDIIHLDECKLNYYSGTYTDFDGMRGQIEAKKERDYKLQQKTLSEKKASGLTEAKAEKKTLEKLGTSALIEKPREYKVSFVIHSPDEQGPAIDVLDASFEYPGKPALFQNLRFRVNTHSRVAIVGPNGVGKSTLLKLMIGTVEPTRGEVSRHNKLRVGVYNQHFEEALPLDKTPIEYLTDLYDIPVLDARKYLGMFGLDGARHTIQVGQLSGGQKARVAFAALSLLRAHILILDEPTNHLDIESVDGLIKALKMYEGGVVLVTHDARLISAMECELWVCGEGETGLRVERLGFERYKRHVMAEMQKQQEQAERKAVERAATKKLLREQRLRAAQTRRTNV